MIPKRMTKAAEVFAKRHQITQEQALEQLLVAIDLTLDEPKYQAVLGVSWAGVFNEVTNQTASRRKSKREYEQRARVEAKLQQIPLAELEISHTNASGYVGVDANGKSWRARVKTSEGWLPLKTHRLREDAANERRLWLIKHAPEKLLSREIQNYYIPFRREHPNKTHEEALQFANEMIRDTRPADPSGKVPTEIEAERKKAAREGELSDGNQSVIPSSVKKTRAELRAEERERVMAARTAEAAARAKIADENLGLLPTETPQGKAQLAREAEEEARAKERKKAAQSGTFASAKTRRAAAEQVRLAKAESEDELEDEGAASWHEVLDAPYEVCYDCRKWLTPAEVEAKWCNDCEAGLSAKDAPEENEPQAMPSEVSDKD